MDACGRAPHRTEYSACVFARVRLALLLLLLLCFGIAFYAYQSYDPRVEVALDRSDVLPEGPGLAPRPAGQGTSLTGRLGRWMHERLDERLGEAPGTKRPADQVRVLLAPVAFGPPGGLHVRVRHADGTPAPATPVTVFAPDVAAASAPRWTDEQGHVQFVGLPSGPGYVVEARGPVSWLLPSSSVRIGVRIEPGPARDVEVVLPGAAIEGQVIDAASGRPVPGATVEVERVVSEGAREASAWVSSGARKSQSLARTVADGEGRFRTGSLPAGSVLVLRARAEDGRVGSMAITPGDGTPAFQVRVALPQAGPGVVLDEGGARVAGARVRITDTDIEARSDATGQFRLERIEPGFLVVERDGVFFRQDPGDVTVTAEASLELRFPTRTAVAVKVVDSTGAAIADAGVTVRGTDGYASDGEGAYRSFARTDANGRARVAVLPGRIEGIEIESTEGSATFEANEGAKSPGSGVRFLAFEGPLGDGDVREVVLDLRRSLVVRGRAVLADGRPAAGARISGEDGRWGGSVPDAVAGADGRFLLLGLEPVVTDGETSEMSLTADLDGVAIAKVKLDPGSAPSTGVGLDVGDVVLRPGALLRGRVVDADGTPVVGATVEGGHLDRRVLTDAQGVYRLPVDPGDSISLVAFAPGARARTVRVVGSLHPGEVRDLEPIALRRPLTLRVRVLDVHGRPIADARVRTPHAPRDAKTALPRTDGTGTVDVPGYDARPSQEAARQTADGLQLDLSALFDRRASGLVEVTLPDGFVVQRELTVHEGARNPFEVVVRVPGRAIFEGVARDEEGAALEGVAVEASVDRVWRGAASPFDIGRVPRAERRTTTDAEGRFRLEVAGVTGERFQVSAKARDGRAASTLVGLPSQGPIALVLRKAGAAGGKIDSGK